LALLTSVFTFQFYSSRSFLDPLFTMRYSLASVLLLAVSAPLTAAAPIAPSNASSKAEAALTTLQTWYNTKTGLWDTMGW